MPYARTNWTKEEILGLLECPISLSGANAHANIHAVSDELHQNLMFQNARVKNQVCFLDNKGKLKKKFEVPAHSTMDADLVADALCNAFNTDAVQTVLRELDEMNGDSEANVKFHINFSSEIGEATLHKRNGTTKVQCNHLFVYLKKNPNQSDLPIIQTIVPYESHAVNNKKGTRKIVSL